MKITHIYYQLNNDSNEAIIHCIEGNGNVIDAMQVVEQTINDIESKGFKIKYE